MKVGVISDTHLSSDIIGAKKIWNRFVTKGGIKKDSLISFLQEYFKDIDILLHAGDIVEYPVISELEKIWKVEAVSGNMDYGDTARMLPKKKILNLNGFNVGLIHGWGAPIGILDRIRREFDNVDAIVFGHTHQAFNEVKDNILFFNPGSLTDRMFASFNSIGILDISEKITGEIIKI